MRGPERRVVAKCVCGLYRPVPRGLLGEGAGKIAEYMGQ